MAMNDCADASIDSRHGEKRERSIASNRVSVENGRNFCIILSVVSMAFAYFAQRTSGRNAHGKLFMERFGFVGWTFSNLVIMAGYALGMQRLLLVKNLVCGWLAVSPLVGACLLGTRETWASQVAFTRKLYWLGAIGFPLQVSREVLKDIEDMDVDRGEKQTIPLLIGVSKAKRIAYSIVAIVNGAMLFLPYYWRMFASNPPVYAMSVVLGLPMCVRASLLPVTKGQRLLKMSIYVLLSGMISGLLIQGR